MRPALLDHDRTRNALLTALLTAARPILSGIFVELEARLDLAHPRPRCDAIVILRRGSEALSIIRDKAVAYKRAATDPAFYEQYGRMPIPLWVAPDERRAEAITRTWRAVWPEGRWYLMTEHSLPGLVAVEYRAGALRPTTLLDGWTLGGEPAGTGQRAT